jgi:hypothetical protein
VVPLRTVLEDPSLFLARVAADGFTTTEAWAKSHETPAWTAFLLSWGVEEPENEESDFSKSGQFSDDGSDDGPFTDDGWRSGEETDDTFEPDIFSEESSDDFIDESE